MFVFIGLLISVFAMLEISHRIRKQSVLFYLFAILLTVMLCFRYGQGTDYHAYEIQYLYVDKAGSYFINTLYHGESGWYMLMLFFRRLNLSFSIFIGFISLLMMISTISVINRYSQYRVFSLLILYPTFYLTYYYSAIRQGLVLALFLSVGLNLLKNRKYLIYSLFILLLSMFHSSAVILLFLPLTLRFKDRKPGKLLIIAFSFAIIIGYTGILNSIATSIGIGSYLKVSISLMAFLLRSILFYVIYTMYKVTKEKRYDDSLVEMLYHIYLIGFLIYIMFAFSGTLSQRLTVPFKGIEVILIPILLSKLHDCGGNDLLDCRYRFTYIKAGHIKILLPVLIVILTLDAEMIKNINSYLQQGNYYSWVNVFNYPYISIFNKESIFNYILHFDK